MKLKSTSQLKQAAISSKNNLDLKEHHRICINCNRAFFSSSSHRETCSDACRKYINQKRKAASQKIAQEIKDLYDAYKLHEKHSKPIIY